MTERNEQGRFAKGNGGGPGRPRRRTEDQYLSATIGAVSIKDWREIVAVAVAKAKRGDARARQWLSDYVMGPPVQRLGGHDGGAIEHVVRVMLADNLHGHNAAKANADASGDPE